ncbi:hypothetical protein D1823_07400 [Ruegeria sp. AD91A]|nr:hypothetical protein D1823_07400 [Ruegeria sp. AD91A]
MLPDSILNIPMNVHNVELIQVLKASISLGIAVFDSPFGPRSVDKRADAIFAPFINFLFFH